MIIVTAGAKWLDIDAYACMVAYAELLRLQGKQAVAATSDAALNESITPDLRVLSVDFVRGYQAKATDQFVLVDISDPAEFDMMVRPDRVTALFDHHVGHEKQWRQQLGDNCRIESVGAAVTLIYEAWAQAGLLDQLSRASAQLMAAGILDNTLNFNAELTSERDREAYADLSKRAELPDDWAQAYFTDCQKLIASDLDTALRNDTKLVTYPGAKSTMYVGQLVLWDAAPMLQTNEVLRTMKAMSPYWYANIIDLARGKSVFISDNTEVQEWLSNLLGVAFTGNTATADRLWLRKEIMKKSLASSAR